MIPLFNNSAAAEKTTIQLSERENNIVYNVVR